MPDYPTLEKLPKTLALAGGVGGAKLAAGLQAVLPDGDPAVVVNTADDFRLWGLHVSPDLDTVMYTLAGIANPQTGWGIRDETFDALGMLGRYGGDTWFMLGDRDLATHVLRTDRLNKGDSLTEITAGLSAALGVGSAVLPMCDEPVSTLVHTPDGPLEFQDYFVRRRQRDEVLGVDLRGVEESPGYVRCFAGSGGSRDRSVLPLEPGREHRAYSGRARHHRGSDGFHRPRKSP